MKRTFNSCLPITDLLDFLPELFSLIKYDEYILFNFFSLENQNSKMHVLEFTFSKFKTGKLQLLPVDSNS